MTRAAVDAIAVSPPGRAIGPGETLDHYCHPLLEAMQTGEGLWETLWSETRRDPFGDIASAVREQRAHLLQWTTATVDDLQRRGLVLPEPDAESIAAHVLIDLEGLLPSIRADPHTALDSYRATRHRLLDRFTPAP